MPRSARLVGAIVLAVAAAQAAALQGASGQGPSQSSTTGAGAGPRFGSPDAVDNQVAADAEPGQPLWSSARRQAWLDFKERVRNRTGITFAVDYSAVFLGASATAGEGVQDYGAGGMVRFYGSWDPLRGAEGADAGLVYKVEHRHGYGDVAPSALSFNLGYVGLFEPPFSNQRWRLTNLYWRHRLKGGRFVLLGGFLDATDYVNVYALASPWLHFMNFAFSSGSAAIALPNDALLGVAAGAMITDNLYVTGSFGDANSDPTDPFHGFDTFFNTREYFKHVEIGWTSSQDRIYFDNAHITFWHVDELSEAGIPAGWGTAFSFTVFPGDRWLPFVRGGFTKDSGSLLEKSISGGIGFQPKPGRDLVGVAFNWGRPNPVSFEASRRNQYALEAFYRFQLSDEIALTPDLQLLIDPAQNQEQRAVWVFGLRARIAF